MSSDNLKNMIIKHVPAPPHNKTMNIYIFSGVSKHFLPLSPYMCKNGMHVQKD